MDFDIPSSLEIIEISLSSVLYRGDFRTAIWLLRVTQMIKQIYMAFWPRPIQSRSNGTKSRFFGLLFVQLFSFRSSSGADSWDMWF